MVLITTTAVIFAFPLFSRQINNIEVKVDSLTQNIDSLYDRQTVELFCYSDIEKGTLIPHKEEKFIELKLSKNAVARSVSIWEGAMSIGPLYFDTKENTIILRGLFSDPETLKLACTDSEFKIIVSYISK